MSKRILLVADGIDAEAAATQSAVAHCRRSGSELALYDPVYEPHLEGYLGHDEVYASLRELLVGQRLEKLEELARTLRTDGSRVTCRAQWVRQRSDAIIDEAARLQADLVVLGRRRKGGLPHMQWRLIESCPVPVLVVSEGSPDTYSNIVAAVDPYHEHGKPADLDLAIVANAQRFRTLHDAKLKIVHCYTPITELAIHGYAEIAVETAERKLEEARRHALRQLAETSGLDAGAAELVAGRPDSVLVGMAEQGDADLIVVGAVSRGVIKELFIGSTAERLLENAQCDVLVVKAPDFAS